MGSSDAVGRARSGSSETTTAVQSVDRAVSILQVIARHGEIGVTAISREIDLHKSTVSRLLSTLEHRGLVEPLPSRAGYRLGSGVHLLAAGASKAPGLALTNHSLLEELADEVGETVNVVVHEGRRAVTVDQALGRSGVASVNWVGRRDWLHATSAGKVFLAAMPSDELEEFLGEGLPRLTDRTITDPDRLRQELETVRSRGYACTVSEQEIGLVAVAAPIRQLDGTVVSALAVSGPSFRLTDDTIPRVARLAVTFADRISLLNGRPKRG